MKAFVKKVEKEITFQGEWTVFYLYISDSCVEIQRRKRMLIIIIPYSLFMLQALTKSILIFYCLNVEDGDQCRKNVTIPYMASHFIQILACITMIPVLRIQNLKFMIPVVILLFLTSIVQGVSTVMRGSVTFWASYQPICNM